MDEKSNITESLPPKGKLVTAGIIFISGFLSPLLIPIVTSSDLSTGWKAALSGLLALGIPELFMMIAAAVAGKEGFNYIKGKVSKILGYKFFVALVLFLAWIIFFDENSIIAHRQNKQRLQEPTQQKVYYKERIESDKQKLEDLNSGLEELEKFAREQYYMSKPGEDVFIVVEENK